MLQPGNAEGEQERLAAPAAAAAALCVHFQHRVPFSNPARLHRLIQTLELHGCMHEALAVVTYMRAVWCAVISSWWLLAVRTF